MRGKRAWVAPVVLTAALTMVTTLVAIAVNAATSVESPWPFGLEAVRARPFLWAVGLMVIAVGLGVALWWWQQREVDTPAIAGQSQASFAGEAFGPVQVGSSGRIDRPAIRQLPIASADFAGRRAEQDKLVGWLTEGPGPHVVNIYGIPGSGKSALAVQVGHLISHRYSDCQLHFNLRSPHRPEAVEDLLGGMLVLLGTPSAEVPAGLALRTAQYRSALAGYRSLVLIDNVSNSSQVEPLLPGSSETAVIITSWTPLPELGVHILPLGQLTMSDAVAMLAAVAQRPISDSDLPAVQRIAEITGSLPLALRICGSLLRVRPHWSWSDLAGRLSDRRGVARLDKLVAGKLAVPASFDLAYNELGETTARGYRLLGLAPSPEFATGLARILISDDVELAESTLDELLVRGLLESRGADTHVMHGLLWARARDLVAQVEKRAVREAAIERMVGWSVTRLDLDYLPRLRSSLSLLPPLPDATPRPNLALADVYVDSPVIAGEAAAATVKLETLLHDRHRVLLVAPGGAGKTTMVNHLCAMAAQQRILHGHGLIPLVVLARDIRGPGADVQLDELLIKTLRHRYEFELAPQALSSALRGGAALLVVDGLDEIVDPGLRSLLARAISDHVRAYPDVPVLVTTRPYDGVVEDFPGFTAARIAPWTPAMVEEYLGRLSSAQGAGALDEHVRSLTRYKSLPPSLATPLGMQLLFQTAGPDGFPRSGLAELMESVLAYGVFSRELFKGTGPGGAYSSNARSRRILEVLAFGMQSNPQNRVTATAAELAEYVASFVPGLPPLSKGDAESFASRFIIFECTTRTTDGDLLFAFTHTAFREHLAASYLAKQPAGEYVDVMARHASDASWNAVFVTSLELREPGRNEQSALVDELVARRNDPHFMRLLESWRAQIRSDSDPSTE